MFLEYIFRFEINVFGQTRLLRTNLFTLITTIFSKVKFIFLSLLDRVLAILDLWMRKTDMCDLAIFSVTKFSCLIKLSHTQSNGSIHFEQLLVTLKFSQVKI